MPLGAGVIGPEASTEWDALPIAAKNVVKTVDVFFGHQSVGRDMLDGVNELGGFDVRSVWSADDYATPTLGEAYLDSNEHPFDKISNYEAFIGRVGGVIDVAAMKLCWIDFNANPDLGALEDAYAAAITRMKSSRPGVRFIHVTTPLTTSDSDNNRRRLAYGTWLKSTYANEAIVLDLASIQSTAPNGTTCTSGGVPALCPAYDSGDGGHLGPVGRERAAKALLYAIYHSR